MNKAEAKEILSKTQLEIEQNNFQDAIFDLAKLAIFCDESYRERERRKR